MIKIDENLTFEESCKACRQILSDVIYNTRDDEGDIDLLRAGSLIGSVRQHIEYIISKLDKNHYYHGELIYLLRTIQELLFFALISSRTDLGYVDIAKLSYSIGIAMQSFQQVSDLFLSKESEKRVVSKTETIAPRIETAE